MFRCRTTTTSSSTTATASTATTATTATTAAGATTTATTPTSTTTSTSTAAAAANATTTTTTTAIVPHSMTRTTTSTTSTAAIASGFIVKTKGHGYACGSSVLKFKLSAGSEPRCLDVQGLVRANPVCFRCYADNMTVPRSAERQLRIFRQLFDRWTISDCVAEAVRKQH